MSETGRVAHGFRPAAAKGRMRLLAMRANGHGPQLASPRAEGIGSGSARISPKRMPGPCSQRSLFCFWEPVCLWQRLPAHRLAPVVDASAPTSTHLSH
jgi:hypothetical protein